MHHDAVMRTTVDLPEDLHRIVLGLARDTGRSVSQTIAHFLRQGLAAPLGVSEAAAPAYRVDATTGLPVVRSSRPVTSEDVRSIEDEG